MARAAIHKLSKFLSACALLATAWLFLRAALLLSAEPCLGVADILDFSRVMEPAGLEHVSPLEAPGYYVRCEFREKEADLWAAPSSAAFLAWAAKGLGFLGPARPGFFALRQMGLLCLLLAAILVNFGLAKGMKPWLALGLVYVIVDPGYLFFFNSFYADGALFLALLGTVVFFERYGYKPTWLGASRKAWTGALLALALLMLLGGGSKMLFVLLPATVLVAWIPQLLIQVRQSPSRSVAAISLLVLIQAVVFWNFFYGAGPRFLEYNNFHALYGGILRVSSHPEDVLDRLRIPAEYRNLPREDAWTAGVPIDHPVHPYLSHLSRLELLGFYLEDPPALSKTLGQIADKLLLIASHPRGTYPRPETDTHPVKRIYGESSQFSNLTRMLYQQWRPAIALLLGLPSLWLLAAAARHSWNGARAAMLLLLLWFFEQCALAVLGEGFINLHQHLVGARLALDFLLIVFLFDLMTTALSKGKKRHSALSFDSEGDPTR